MKIAITGAGGTGKSTLAKALAEATGETFMPSPSRGCFVKHGVKTEDDQRNLTPEARYALQMDIFKAIDTQVMETTSGIFDRTHLDNMFYGFWQCREMISNEQFDAMWRTTIKGFLTFDIVVVCPMFKWCMDLPSDGMRTTSHVSRIMMDHFIYAFIDKIYANGFPIPIVRAGDTPVGERVNFILRSLEEGR